jgi:hypothetical protein
MKKPFLAVFVLSLLLSGCDHIPLIKMQDQRFDKNAPIYLSRDPNRKTGAPKDLTEDELKGKR